MTQEEPVHHLACQQGSSLCVRGFSDKLQPYVSYVSMLIVITSRYPNVSMVRHTLDISLCIAAAWQNNSTLPLKTILLVLLSVLL